MAETEPHLTEQVQIRGKTSKYSTNFMYKASLALIFLAIVTLFPSQAPEFINQTVPNRSWELLHLIFVGIAVSYGLFSSRNREETEKELHSSNFDSAQSYFSGLLQVPSVFDDEPETQSGSTDEISKLETWSSQYVRDEPVVFLAKEYKPSVVDQQRVNSVSSSSRVGEKPLLLPVRSLKSLVLDETKEPIDETCDVCSNPSISRSSSNLGSKRFEGSDNLPGQMRSSQKLGRSDEKVEEKEAVVLPSPIPWRSRSGRMEMNDLQGPASPFSSMGDFDHLQAKPEASKRQISAPFRPNSGSKISPSPKKSSISSELQAKTAEDFVRRKSFQKSPPPLPPPPPPPPSVTLRSSSMAPRSSSGSHLDRVTLHKDLRRSYSSEQKNATRNHSGIDMKPASIPLHDVGRSVGTFRARKDGDFGEYYDAVEADEEMTLVAKKTGKKTDIAPKSSFLRPPEGFVDEVVSESDEQSPASENDAGAISKNEEVGPDNSVNDAGPDVDKKADEFIAKFREQIRLQRIDSIKRSSVEISRSLSRCTIV